MNEDDLKKNLSNQHWRLNNLYYIQDKEGKKVLFQMNWAQESFYRAMWFLNVILKARQLGFTTFIDIFILDCCLFNSNTRAGIIAHTLADAGEIFETKIKFPFDNLPEVLRNRLKGKTDSASKLTFSNGSSVRVGTSMRSGTLNYLHISEHGKICARNPEKAKEIRTGALNTVEAGQFIFDESTAEGKEGDFFEFSERAKKLLLAGRELSKLDYKFHFYAWHQNPKYRLDPKGVLITKEHVEYFEKLEQLHGISLDDQQKAWYVKKEETQKEEMKREFPSTPEEAFEAAIEGAYFGNQMARARADGRITKVPWEPSLPVNTFWDLGMDDSMTIWFHQRFGLQNRFIRAFSGSGEDFPFYVNELNRHPYVYGEHYLPHDVEVRILGALSEMGKPRTRKQTLINLGVKPIIVVSQTKNVLEDINEVRKILPSCYFDEENCKKGIQGLEEYRKEWDTKAETWKSHPRHDWTSHWADGFRTFAMGYRHRETIPSQANGDVGFGII